MRVTRLAGVLVLCAIVLGASVADADHTSQPKGLSALLPNLFGAGGILLAPPAVGFSHAAHFTAESEAQLTVLNDSLRSQLSTLPLPSPSGGFSFQFDPTLGSFTPTTDSFGPIYSQRANTTGRGRLTFGGSYSRFTFDSLDGKNLDNGELQVTFLHEPTGGALGLPPFFFEADTITAKITADITSDVFVLAATYGILDNLDLSIALPIIHTNIRLKGVATINHIGTAATPAIHKFSNGQDTLEVRSSDEDTGVGDLLLRAKWNFYNPGPVLLATSLDLRLPSGSVDNLRGVGTPVVSPAFIASTRPFAGFSPHVNVGFHFSGDTSKIDHEFFYAVGVDWTVVKPLTLVLDFLGRRILDNHRIEAGQAPGGTKISGDNIVDVAFGLKVNIWKNVLGVASVLIPLNKTGLRDDVTPLFGLEVSF
jgi:hypothetical protein